MDKKLITRVPVLIAIVVALCGFVFLRVADEMMEGETLKFDNAILLAMRNPADRAKPIGPDWMLPAAQDISALGSVTVISLFTIISVGYFVVARRTRTATGLVVSIAGATILIVLLKILFARERPDVVPHLTQVADASFPSGHSMISAMFYLTLAAMIARSTESKSVRVYFLVMAILISLAIGLTRIYLGVHYPTDVIAGWCIDTAWACASYLLTYLVEAKVAK